MAGSLVEEQGHGKRQREFQDGRGPDRNRAAAGKLRFRVDFQTRTEPNHREAVKRVQGGDIGTFISGEALYACGPTWGGQAQFLRAWGLHRALSGGIMD